MGVEFQGNRHQPGVDWLEKLEQLCPSRLACPSLAASPAGEISCPCKGDARQKSTIQLLLKISCILALLASRSNTHFFPEEASSPEVGGFLRMKVVNLCLMSTMPW